jgi:hypothetical protein
MKKELKITPKKQIMPKEVEEIPQIQEAEAFADKILINMRSTENVGTTKRVNFDMPTYLFDLMNDKVKRKGYSIKNYLTTLVRKDLGDE